ncbi:osteocrin isoform X2 [Amphiprion ocellaris]|nr:osteocrin isoform X2 [Amphiprion ocellaris]
MSSCSCLLFCFLLSFIAVLHGSDQHVDRPLPRPRPRGVKVGEELTAKLLRLDDLVRMENDVMEPKRKRSFPGNNAPLDRLSVSSMETKQTTNKQSKVVELPRRRSNPPPIDRIGMSRLPNSRG